MVTACSGGGDNGNSNGATNGSPNGATNGSTNGATNSGSNGATNGATNANTNGATNGSTNGATNSHTNGATNGNTNGAVMVPCHDLTYEISCNNPRAAEGYPGCSDYFGDVTGVEATCSTTPLIEVGNTPCAAYEFPVGSCVYYSEALPNRCYVTHVGSDTADGVAAGQTFWEGACTGEWIPAM